MYSLDVLLVLFGTSLLFHVQFWLLLPDLHIGFSRGMSDGLVSPSLEKFSTVCCDPHSKRLSHSQRGRSRCSSGILLLFLWSNRYWQFDLCFLCLFESSLNIWKFSVHVLQKPSLKEFENNLSSMGNECNCAVIWTFFGIALLWDWNKNWPFQVLWPLLSFQKLLLYWVQHFTSITFYILMAQLDFHHPH